MKKRVILTVFGLLLIGVAALVYYGQLRERSKETAYSGSIEITDADLAFQTGGRVSAVLLREGQPVAAGQPVARLDSSEAQSKFEQASAALERAKRNRDQLATALGIYETTLPADLKRAQANLARARNLKLDAARNDARFAALAQQGVVAAKEREAFGLTYQNAAASQSEAGAAVDAARANLKRVEATRQDLAAAEAAVKQAEAAVKQAAIQLNYCELKAPTSGTITSRSIEPGEVVTAGQTIVSLSEMDPAYLKIYVDETSIASVRPNQAVTVKVDSLPGRSLKGRVSYISPEAEFTPKIIQTSKERVKLVYLVKVAIANPQAQLKAGMPADAYLR